MTIPGWRALVAAWLWQGGMLGRRRCGGGRFKGWVSARARNVPMGLLWLPSASSPPPLPPPLSPPWMLAAMAPLPCCWGQSEVVSPAETRHNLAHINCWQSLKFWGQNPQIWCPRGLSCQGELGALAEAQSHGMRGCPPAGSGTHLHGPAPTRAPVVCVPCTLWCVPARPCSGIQTLAHFYLSLFTCARSGMSLCVLAHRRTLSHFCMSSFTCGRCDKSLRILAHRYTPCHPSPCPSSHLHTLVCSRVSLLCCPHSCTLLHVPARSRCLQVQAKALPVLPRLGCGVGVWHSLGRPDNPARRDPGHLRGTWGPMGCHSSWGQQGFGAHGVPAGTHYRGLCAALGCRRGPGHAAGCGESQPVSSHPSGAPAATDSC